MGVICQILIKKPKEGVHRAGKSVTGIVKYAVDEPTEFKDVTLSFLGKGKCEWNEKRGKSSVTYTGKEYYIVHHINICDKANKSITLHGEYQYPFEFFLPEDIPRSFKDKTGSITYTIVLKLVKSCFFSVNKVFSAKIPVYSYVTPTSVGPVIFGLDKRFLSMFATKSPKVNLKVKINKTCFTPGENILLRYSLNNDTNLEITSVQAELYCYITYTADCGHTKEKKIKFEACEVKTRSIAKISTFQYTITLPTLPHMYSIMNSKVIKKEYRIRVTIQLPFFYKNASVEMPVIIGEQKVRTDPAVEAREGEPPPSYWEAICEAKEESQTN